MLPADGELNGWENLPIAATLYRFPRVRRAPRIRDALCFMVEHASTAFGILPDFTVQGIALALPAVLAARLYSRIVD